jgi:hypothetical protein
MARIRTSRACAQKLVRAAFDGPNNRVLDVVVFEEEDESPFVAMLRVEAA